MTSAAVRCMSFRLHGIDVIRWCAWICRWARRTVSARRPKSEYLHTIYEHAQYPELRGGAVFKVSDPIVNAGLLTNRNRLSGINRSEWEFENCRWLRHASRVGSVPARIVERRTARSGNIAVRIVRCNGHWLERCAERARRSCGAVAGCLGASFRKQSSCK